MDIEFPEIVGTLADLPEQTLKTAKAYAKATAAINISRILMELKELRAYKDAAEKQEPVAFWITGPNVDIAARSVDCEKLKADQPDWEISPLYAEPIPADRVPDAIKLLQRVAASSVDKSAVAVPDDWRMKAAEWLKKKAEEQHKINLANPEHTKAYHYWEQKVRELNWLQAELSVAAPSHSQQSARIDAPSELVKQLSVPYPHPRISEQDAREIIEHFCNWTKIKSPCAASKSWLEELGGRELLAKLNAEKADSSGAQQSDPNLLTWLPSLLNHYEKQARLNGFTPDTSLEMVRAALANVYDTVRDCCPSHEREQPAVCESVQTEPDRSGMYFYRNNDCAALHPQSPDCKCWYKYGTGPLSNIKSESEQGGAE